MPGLLGDLGEAERARLGLLAHHDGCERLDPVPGDLGGRLAFTRLSRRPAHGRPGLPRGRDRSSLPFNAAGNEPDGRVEDGALVSQPAIASSSPARHPTDARRGDPHGRTEYP